MEVALALCNLRLTSDGDSVHFRTAINCCHHRTFVTAVRLNVPVNNALLCTGSIRSSDRISYRKAGIKCVTTINKMDSSRATSFVVGTMSTLFYEGDL